MRDRPAARPHDRRSAITLDLVLCTPHGRGLAILLVPAEAGRGWVLPHSAFTGAEDLARTAAGIAGRALGHAPAWLAQMGAFGDARGHPAHAALSVAFVGVCPPHAGATAGRGRWFPSRRLPALASRQRDMVADALAALRERMDGAPIAFRLLPPTFTLTALQGSYELLLGRRLHKASFRRALHAARLVEPVRRWTEGRGRPAQLYRYAPHGRRGSRRSVRFDRLGGD